MTLNDLDLMAVTLHYFTEFVEPVFQHIITSICGGVHAQVYCSLQCMYAVVAISSRDEFLVCF